MCGRKDFFFRLHGVLRTKTNNINHNPFRFRLFPKCMNFFLFLYLKKKKFSCMESYFDV
jgi:hypothetical protein